MRRCCVGFVDSIGSVYELVDLYSYTQNTSHTTASENGQNLTSFSI